MSKSLLLIDPQVDFCSPQGSLFVPGADQDMERVAAWIVRHAPTINSVHVTLDQHYLIDVAHPGFWRDGAGRHPDPFTIIREEDMRKRAWEPVRPKIWNRMRSYLRELEHRGKDPLCIWPEHCLIGSGGAAMVGCIDQALRHWSGIQGKNVHFIPKGSNIYTEHYSAIRAEVVYQTDDATWTNKGLLCVLRNAAVKGEVFIAGEAGSHCVRATMMDVVEELKEHVVFDHWTLLTDGMSPVPGYEERQERFIREMVGQGMRAMTTEEA